MIEGQEGVSWEDWLALAKACEAHGVPALFRSDHYLNLGGSPRARLARRLGDDQRARRRHLDAAARHARLPRDVPPSRPSWRRSSRPPTTCPAAGSSSASARAGTSPSTAPTASRSRRCASAWTGSPSSSRSCTARGPSRRSRSPGAHYELEGARRAAAPAAGAAPAAADGRRPAGRAALRSPRAGRTSTTRRSRSLGGGALAQGRGRRGVLRGGPRADPVLADDRLPGRARPRGAAREGRRARVRDGRAGPRRRRLARLAAGGVDRRHGRRGRRRGSPRCATPAWRA